MIGFNNLSLWVDTRNETRITTPVFIIMNNPFWNKFCTLVMVVMVLLNSINMGAQLDISIIVKVLKKPHIYKSKDKENEDKDTIVKVFKNMVVQRQNHR